MNDEKIARLLGDPTGDMNEEDAAKWKELDGEIKKLMAERSLELELKKKSFSFRRRNQAEERLKELTSIISRLKKQRTALENRSRSMTTAGDSTS